MKIFVDSADLNEIKAVAEYGWVDGITTNPSLMAKQGIHEINDMKRRIAEICILVSGPVSAEVIAIEADAMWQEAIELSAIAPHVCVKLPLTQSGLKVAWRLSQKGISTNMTLCFSAGQALLARKSGARFVSPFVGRFDDLGVLGMDLIVEIRQLYDQLQARADLNADTKMTATQILAASIRHPLHVVQAAKSGADAITAPSQVILALIKHPMTDAGLQQFLRDWNADASRT